MKKLLISIILLALLQSTTDVQCIDKTFSLEQNSKSISNGKGPDKRVGQILKLSEEIEKKYKGGNPLISAFLITAQRYKESFPNGMSGMDRIFLNSLRFSGVSEEKIRKIVDNFNNLPNDIKERFVDKRKADRGYQRDNLFDEYIFFTKDVLLGSVEVYSDRIDLKSPAIDKCKESHNEKSPRILRILPPHGIEPETWPVEPLSKVRLIGQNFREKAKVFIHPVRKKNLMVYSSEVKVINHGEIEFRIPEALTHLPDMYRVVVENTDGTCSGEDNDLLEILPHRYSITISRIKMTKNASDSALRLTHIVSDGTVVYARNTKIYNEPLVSHFRPKNGIIYLKLMTFERTSEDIMDNSFINMVLTFTSPIVTCISLEWEKIEKKPLCAVSGVEAVSDLLTMLNILSGNHYIGSFNEFYNVASLERLSNRQKKINIGNFLVYVKFERHLNLVKTGNSVP